MTLMALSVGLTLARLALVACAWRQASRGHIAVAGALLGVALVHTLIRC